MAPPTLESHERPDPEGSPPGELSPSNTRHIVGLVSGANQTCGASIGASYQIDCLRAYYLQLAKSLPDSGEYLPIKQALNNAADRLGRIVQRYADPSAPKLRLSGRYNPNMPPLPDLTPIRKGSERRAAAEAQKVVQETTMIILRSGDDPSRRTAHYQQIAAAVESNMVILRSS